MKVEDDLSSCGLLPGLGFLKPGAWGYSYVEREASAYTSREFP